MTRTLLIGTIFFLTALPIVQAWTGNLASEKSGHGLSVDRTDVDKTKEVGASWFALSKAALGKMHNAACGAAVFALVMFLVVSIDKVIVGHTCNIEEAIGGMRTGAIIFAAAGGYFGYTHCINFLQLLHL